MSPKIGAECLGFEEESVIVERPEPDCEDDEHLKEAAK